MSPEKQNKKNGSAFGSCRNISLLVSLFDCHNSGDTILNYFFLGPGFCFRGIRAVIFSSLVRKSLSPRGRPHPFCMDYSVSIQRPRTSIYFHCTCLVYSPAIQRVVPSGLGYLKTDYLLWLQQTDWAVIIRMFGHFPLYDEWVLWRQSGASGMTVSW